MRYYGGMTRLNTLSLPFLLLPALVLLGSRPCRLHG